MSQSKKVEQKLRDEFMTRTTALISDITEGLPAWISRSAGTGIWVFSDTGQKAKYLLEEVAQERSTDPKTALCLLQDAVAGTPDSYGLMIVVGAALCSDKAAMSMEEAAELVKSLQDDPEVAKKLPKAELIYRETRDGFCDLFILTVDPTTHKAKVTTSGPFGVMPPEVIGKRMGLKTFGVKPEDRSTQN